jgi:PAS domain S-box-containing protein
MAPCSPSTSRYGPDGAVRGTCTVARDLTAQALAEQERLRSLETAARLGAIVEAANEAIVEKDLSGRIITWNAAAERIYGVSAEDALSRPPGEIFDPQEIERGRELRDRTVAGEALDNERRERVGPNGERQVLSVTSIALRDPEGRVISTATVARDLTSQALAEQERLRSLETAARLGAIVEAANEAIVSSDAEGRIVYANPAVERLFGFSPGEMLGSGWLETVPPELLERDRAAINLAIAGELPGGFVTQRVRRDGSIADVHVSSIALRDAEGNFTGSASFVSDITDRVRQERAAAERSADIEAIFTNASEGIVLLDRTFSVRTFNQAARQLILRLHNGEIGEGHSVLRWVLPEDHAEFTRDLERALGGRTFTFARTVVGGGGDYWWEFSFSPIVLPDGSVRGVALRMRDLTEVKRTADALVQAQKAESLAVLAGGIAHDFNNLLVGILLNASLVLNDLPPGSPGRKTVQAIETSGQRAADLARQMLAYSGRGSFVIRNTGLNPVVKEMTELLRSSIGKGVTLDLDLDPALPRIEADVTQLRQVIMNLVVNASDAIGAGEGIIRISTRPVQMTKLTLRQVYLAPGLKPGRYVALEVSDTGSGMDRETLARIFDPFFTTKFTGRGLGLAAVLGIMRGHKGAIKVDSSPGRGTTFRLLFPAVAARDEQPAGGVTAPASATAGTVLIVDDEPAVRAVTARALRTFGLDVIEADDGVAGLEAFAAQGSRISCVLLDLTMPRMGGEETFAAIRDLDPEVPVLLMSGFSEDEGKQRFDGLGIAAFIEKPFALATLRSAIQGAIDQRRGRLPHR